MGTFLRWVFGVIGFVLIIGGANALGGAAAVVLAVGVLIMAGIAAALQVDVREKPKH